MADPLETLERLPKLTPLYEAKGRAMSAWISHEGKVDPLEDDRLRLAFNEATMAVKAAEAPYTNLTALEIEALVERIRKAEAERDELLASVMGSADEDRAALAVKVAVCASLTEAFLDAAGFVALPGDELAGLTKEGETDA